MSEITTNNKDIVYIPYVPITISNILYTLSKEKQMVICNGFMDYLLLSSKTGHYSVYNTEFFDHDVKAVMYSDDGRIEIFLKLYEYKFETTGGTNG